MAREGSAGDPHYVIQQDVGAPSGASVRKLVTGPDPAAGAEITDQVVPAGKAWKLLSVRVDLVQGLTQTPQPILRLTDNADVVFYESFGSSAAQAVSTTTRYVWAPGLALSGQVGATVNVHSTAPLPNDLILPAGWKIKSSTLGIGANSDYGTPIFYVVEFG